LAEDSSDRSARRAACVALAFAALAAIGGCSGSSSGEAPDASNDATAADASADAGLDASADGCADATTSRSGVDPATTPELAIASDAGAPATGVFDPSLAIDGTTAYMSYSVVPSQLAISTRVAVSSDRGATFTDLAAVNVPVDVPCDGGSCPRIVFEVSSMIVDDGDPSARFKIFSHAYAVFPPDPTPFYQLGFIALQTSANAAGPYSQPTPAFDAAALRAVPALADCDVFTEPGAIVRGGNVDLALGCVTAASRSIRVVLLRSTDHARTFTYVSELVGWADALALGSTTAQLNAADLFVAGGREYLVVSPTAKVTLPNSATFDGYGGCLVVPMNGDAVARDCAGNVMVARSILGPPGQFIGACTFREAATGAGYLVPEAVFSDTRRFRIFRPGIAGP